MQSPSWEANWFEASQEIPQISRNPNVHYRTHKRPPPVSILGQPNTVHMFNVRLLFISCGAAAPTRAMAFSFMRFLDHTQRRITVGRNPLDERSARRRDLYLTTHNTHNRKTSMPPVGFEPTISAGERPQTARPLGPALTYDYVSEFIFYAKHKKRHLL